MDAGLSPATPTPHRSRAARRAEALRAETAATAALNVLGQKWVLRIIRALGERTQRFCELQDALGGANSATLSQRLKLLEDEGLIERRAISAVPAVGGVLAHRRRAASCAWRSRASTAGPIAGRATQ